MKPADKAPGEGARKPPQATSKAQRKQKKPRCPICDRPASQAHRPFCSKHCADIDLSRWLGGEYVIPGEPAFEQDEEQEK